MKSKANSDSATKNSNSSGSSVPISVYRELAAELQATRAMVDSLNAKNQELTLHNQKLRQEISRFVQSAVALRSLVDPTQPPLNLSPSVNQPGSRVSNSPPAKSLQFHADADSMPTLEETVAASTIAAQLRASDPTAADLLFTAEQERLRTPQERKPRDLGGLWLTLVVVLIMVTAFGAGFLVVRPLLPTSNSNN